MNTGDWIQIGFITLTIGILVLVVYSWFSWPLWISLCITMAVLLLIRWVRQRIEL